MNLKEILQLAVECVASDIHFKVGMPPIFRINGQLKPLLNVSKLSEKDTRQMALGLMNEVQQNNFLQKHELDTAYSLSGIARFRVNIFQQRSAIGLVFRVIPPYLKNFDELYIPEVISQLAMEQRGLVIVTGATGSGKSTTLAAMIEYINTHRSCSIVTIEDPIEFTYKDQKSIINQREVCVDTESFAVALRQALRQDPDVIMVGEMRDQETISTALSASETGHLVLSTMHSTDVTEAINRILAVFPEGQQPQIRYQLASVIKGIIAMRLIPRASGKGRVPAMEIMLSTSNIRDCIRNPVRQSEIKDVIAEGRSTYGMQTFDQALFALYKKDLISRDDAIRYSSNPNDFQIRMMGIQNNMDDSQEATRSIPNAPHTPIPPAKERNDTTTVYHFSLAK